MESHLGFVPILFFASLLFFVFTPSFTTALTKIVEIVCNQTINNSECLKALDSDPRTVTASNYKELAPIALDLAITNAKTSQAIVNNLNKTNPIEAVKQCAYAYGFVVMNFINAKKELTEDPLLANYDIMVVSDDIGTCETALKAGVQVPAISSL